MTRKEFVHICGLLGIGLPLQLKLTSCTEEDIAPLKSGEKILIIGAGAAGLSAAYFLIIKEWRSKFWKPLQPMEVG